MRMRYRYVTERYTNGSPQQLERHYRQLLQDALWESQKPTLQRDATWRPLADIHESVDVITVKIELAGIKEEDIDVMLYADALIVSGVRYDEHEPGDNLYYHEAQIRYGPFRVEVLNLAAIQREDVTARYEHGFLWIDLPKIRENPAERIRVRSDIPDELH